MIPYVQSNVIKYPTQKSGTTNYLIFSFIYP